MPDEMLDLYLCRDIYHCPPSVLGEEDGETIAQHLILMDVEAKVKERRK